MDDMSSRFSTILVQFYDICSDFHFSTQDVESKEDWTNNPVLFLLIAIVRVYGSSGAGDSMIGSKVVWGDGMLKSVKF